MLTITVLIFGGLCGCAQGETNTEETVEDSETFNPGSVREVTSQEALSLMTSDRVSIVDVREQDEYDASHIPNALLFPVGQIDAEHAETLLPDKSATVIVYCHTGVRAREAAQKLVDLGYKDVVNMGGITTWPFETIDAEVADEGTVENDELPVGVKVVCGQTRSLPESDTQDDTGQ